MKNYASSMFKYSCTLLMVLMFPVSGCALSNNQPPISVKHLSPQGSIPKKQSYRTVAYYRTEVKNLTNSPVTITHFEGYHFVNNKWIPGNILDKKLDGQDFSNWYREDDIIINGIIPAGKTAVCDVNWHGSSDHELSKSKWSYTVQDSQGNIYISEAIVDPKITIIKYKKQ